MNKILPAFFLTFTIILSSVSFAQENGKGLLMSNMKAGVIEPFKGTFVLKKEQLKRINNTILEAKSELVEETELIIYFFINHHLYHEVGSLSEIFDCANAPDMQITKLGWILRQNIKPSDKSKKYNTILALEYKLKRGARLLIQHTDKHWSSNTASKLKTKIRRTIKREFNFLNLILIIALVILYYFLALLLCHLILFLKFNNYAVEILVNLNMVALITFFPMLGLFVIIRKFDSIGTWLHSKPSYFLWGEMNEHYSSALSLNSNIFWGVIVAVIVSVVANYFSRKFK